MRFFNKLCQENGITLIALIVTVIVLVIFVNVSLNLISGGNGVITKASSTADTTYITMAKEKIELRISEYLSKFYEDKYYTDEIGANTPFCEWLYTKYGGENNHQKVNDLKYTITNQDDIYVITVKSNGKLKQNLIGTINQSGIIDWNN